MKIMELKWFYKDSVANLKQDELFLMLLRQLGGWETRAKKMRCALPNQIDSVAHFHLRETAVAIVA